VQILIDRHRDFAANIGIKFQTPEEFFLNEEEKVFTRAFDPVLHLNTVTVSNQDQRGEHKLISNRSMLKSMVTGFSRRNDLDLVLLCGSPASGKSTFYWKYLAPLGYERVNQDTLKTVSIRHWPPYEDG